MSGPFLALILFICFFLFYYYYQEYFSFIPKTLSLIFGFMVLVLPQYVETIPNYLFYQSHLLNAKHKENSQLRTPSSSIIGK